MASYLIACLLLFGYDRVTGNAPLAETVLETNTASSVIPAATPAPTITQAPTLAPDLSALSPIDQSLVIYIAEASALGVLGGEITLILKSTGWLDADIARGFELVRTYYPGVLK